MEDRQMNINNDQIFLQMLAEMDPQLYRIKAKLLQRNINSDFIPAIIDQISNVYRSTGQGKVEIIINQGKIEFVIGQSNLKVDMSIE